MITPLLVWRTASWRAIRSLAAQRASEPPPCGAAGCCGRETSLTCLRRTVSARTRGKVFGRRLRSTSSAPTAQLRCVRSACTPPAARASARTHVNGTQAASLQHWAPPEHVAYGFSGRRTAESPARARVAGLRASAGGASRLRAVAFSWECAVSWSAPMRSASQPSLSRGARSGRCARPHWRSPASCLRAHAVSSAHACHTAAATKMADVRADIGRRSRRTRLRGASLRHVHAAQRAPARSAARCWLLGCH